MSFGENLLKKYGWKEGESLGKDGTGIAVPVKAHRKTNHAGLGASAATEVKGGNWWERVFNEAADNLDVETSSTGVTLSQKDVDGVEITNKSYSVRKLKEKNENIKYGSFLKAASLEAGKETEVSNRTKVEDLELKPVEALTDEQLFKACGGLTAHKGARHGLNLTGKLARMEEQDKLLMDRIKGKAEVGMFRSSEPEWTTVKEKKKEKKHISSLVIDMESDGDEIQETLDSTEYSTLSKKKRKTMKKTAEELAKTVERAFGGITSKFVKPEEVKSVEVVLAKVSDGSKVIKKKKKSKKKNKEPKDVLTAQALDMLRDAIETKDGDLTIEKKRKKGKKSKKDEVDPPKQLVQPKKRKRLQSASDDDEGSDDQVDQVEKLNEEVSNLRQNGKKRVKEVVLNEFHKLHAEVAAEKGVKFESEKQSKNSKKLAKRRALKQLEELQF